MEQPDYGASLYLHGHREIVLGFWREEHIHCFLWKWLIASWWCPHFNDVQLSRYRELWINSRLHKNINLSAHRKNYELDKNIEI